MSGIASLQQYDHLHSENEDWALIMRTRLRQVEKRLQLVLLLCGQMVCMANLAVIIPN